MYIFSERLHPRLQSFILPQALTVKTDAAGQFIKRIFTKCDLPHSYRIFWAVKAFLRGTARG
jgi:hypothetical protein